MKDWIIQHKKYGFVIVLASLLGVYYFSDNSAEVSLSNQTQNTNTKTQMVEKKTESQNNTVQPKQIEKMMVDVKGQVKKPGVYLANTGERVNDVIARAGGLTDKADQGQVNFAEHVKDEMVIYIPAVGEKTADLPNTVTKEGGTPSGTSSQNQAKVNLNKADETQLQTLPGIGPAKAKMILDYRDKSGPFKSIEDLKNISGIGDKTYEKLKDLIDV
ncbi:helix-hairpin-helix domain-containing protein [Bacillus sp. BRMEA1]|uniref:helix-hairpin-helix domain-containing protein n=1 Tax=Neobacillus endophyticus TaxID=2738405 RepID=UPI0015672486|nr:helix-hairpin-helix domain-containing protein [Neobacillus endophyticus]NRD75902.1 helix-hairpin-helix domain-containing protein [Neobacillus endophyticus]